MEKIKILFAGDFCVRGEGIKNISNSYGEGIASSVRKVTDRYDISMVNIETVFTDELSPVKKSGPTLASPVNALELLKKMNFTIGAFANNHVCDQGAEKGLASIKMVEDTGMLTIGCGKNLSEALKPVRIEKKGIKLSFLNFAENEFSPAGVQEFGFAPLDYYDNGRMIKAEKEISDFVFVMLHAGNETCPFPRSGIKKITRHFIDCGADAVVISHPHTAQGYEYYCDKPIIYSTGNFFMTKRTESFTLWNMGYMADITINENKTVSFTPIPYEFASYGEYFKILDGERKDKFLKYLDALCDILKIDKESYKRLEYAWSVGYVEDSWDSFLEEMANDKSSDGEFMLFTKNAFCCESHNEVMQNFFTVHTTNMAKELKKEKAMISNWLKLPV